MNGIYFSYRYGNELWFYYFKYIYREEDESLVKKIKMDDDLGGGLVDIIKVEVIEVSLNWMILK